MYLKDYINDTLYRFENSNLYPAYVFDFGKYAYTTEQLEIRNLNKPFPFGEAFIFDLASGIVGTPKFFFYQLFIPSSFSRPKVKPNYNPIAQKFRENTLLCGIYNIEQKTNILLDTDPHFQQGLVNDLNGGLPVIPRYYAGNDIVVDLWYAEEMREMLTDEYFSSQTIKDRQAHQKLKEILKNLKDDDNPVVVIAKLK